MAGGGQAGGMELGVRDCMHSGAFSLNYWLRGDFSEERHLPGTTWLPGNSTARSHTYTSRGERGAPADMRVHTLLSQ